MSFNRDDLYFASGSVPLRNCWTANVTKFDSSSFYNWEQDNMPIYDLEERTYLNWEKLGFPTSSLPGMVLTVSGDADLDSDNDGVNDCNTKIFNDLSSAIASLPERITFPVLIEVGSYGDLGNVEINGIDFGPSGSLEIINRNFAKGYSDICQASAIQLTGAHAPYDIINHVSSMDVSATFRDTSCVNISALVLSATNDPRAVGATRAVTMFPGYKDTISNAIETTRLGVSINTTNNAFQTAASSFQLPIYEAESGLGNELLGDVSTVAVIGDLAQAKGSGNLLFNHLPHQNNCVSLIYNNFLQSITIEGCNGPVFVRNFFVDGEKVRENGVTIRNSNDVLLENFTAVRCTKNGYLIEDSEVKAARGLVAYRCYGFSTGTTRLNPAWTSVSSLGPVGNDDAAGIRLINSHLTLSSAVSGGTDIQPQASAVDFMLNFSRCSNGIVLENSVLDGGNAQEGSDGESGTYLITQLNAEYGIKATNSIIDFNGRLKIEGNSRGTHLINSQIYIDAVEGSTNQFECFNLKNSQMIYGKNKNQMGNYTTRWLSLKYEQMYFFSNGQDIVLDNSTMDIFPTSSLDLNFGKIKAFGSHGVNSSKQGGDDVRLPTIELNNNSYARLVHYSTIQKSLGVNTTVTNDSPVYGLCLAAKGGSKALFQGSFNAATLLVGPNTYSHQKRMAGVYAQGESSVEFNGPTVISKFGVDVLAEDNSEITFGPARSKSTGGLDISSFNLGPSATGPNHTSVELHATKACLVVNRGSVLNIKDVGDYSHCWVSGSNGAGLLASGMTYDTSGELDIAKYTSAGSFQFYPNPNDVDDYADGAVGPGIANVAPSTIAIWSAEGNDKMRLETDHGRWNYYFTDAIFNPAEQSIGVGNVGPSAITGGGVCVRAVNGSKVNVQNVNFPTGWWNPSATIYDTSTGLLCDRLFIWNIADNSTMHASYISVSGLHGIDAGYHGPSGVWGSGTANSLVAYGAPSSTPDSSSLSLLDVFGKSVGNILPNRQMTGSIGLGSQTFTNFGPFRIYVSPAGYVNYLTTPSISTEDIYGAPYQIFSQGYQASGNLSAAPSVSAVWDDVVEWNTAGTALATTKFFYTSSVLAGSQAARIMLDQSAANAFANAKHGASGKSGRQKIFTIYDAHKSIGGEGATNAVKSLGRGFKSSNVFDLGRDE